MSRIKPIWRIVLGFLFLMAVVYNSSMLAFGGSFAGFAVMAALFVVYVVYAIKTPYDDPLRSMRDLMAQQQAQAEQEKAEAARKVEADRQARLDAARAEREEWARQHGVITFAVAGVTFDNDDGTSRQRLLKDIRARGGDADLELEEWEYKGKPACRVLVDGEQIGNVPRHKVEEVLSVLDRLEEASIDVGTFRPEEEEDEDGNVRRRGELIYRADVRLVYSR